MINNTALFAAAAILLLVLLLSSPLFSPPFVTITMAQQQQEQMTTTTTTSTSLLSPPLTPEEQEQQNRLQNVIAATTANLNETEKQIGGIVFTPRWSEPVWVNPNSISVLLAYCLPGEFAESGQEILGGFELEVLESYEVALPQGGFMAWMMVVGNEDRQDRLPAAVGVICASDLNDTESRILSPQEQQQINSINQQFTTIQNTQITNIDQVINIINNVTTPQNGTGGVTEPPFTAEIIPNATSGFTLNWFELKSNVRGGTGPYTYEWEFTPMGLYGTLCTSDPSIDPVRCIAVTTYRPGTHGVSLTVTDSKNQIASDSVQITIKERPQGGLLGEGVLDDATVAGGDFRAEIIANATEVYTPATIRFDASIRGGIPPYSYSWSSNLGLIDQDRSMTLNFFEPGIFTYTLTVTDSMGQTVTDAIQITAEERPGGVLLPPETGQEGQPQGGGLLPGIAPGGEGGGGTIGPTEEGIPPLSTAPDEGEEQAGEDTIGEGGTPSSTTGEQQEPSSSPPSDGTEEGG